MKNQQIISKLEDVLRADLTELSEDNLSGFSSEEFRQIDRLYLFLENEVLTERYCGLACQDLEGVRLSIRVEDGEYVFPRASRPQILETLPHWVAGQIEFILLTECPQIKVRREILIDRVRAHRATLYTDFESVLPVIAEILEELTGDPGWWGISPFADPGWN